MTRARSGDRRRVLVFSASFGGPHDEAASALTAYLRQHHAAEVDVTQIDFLEHFMPSVNVLARFGYQQTARFFPDLTGSVADAAALEPDNPFMHELAAGAQARVGDYLDELRPDAVLSVLPAAGAVVSETAARREILSAAVLTDFTAHGIWLHPRTHRYFVPTTEMRDELVVRGVEWGRIGVAGLPVTAEGVAGRTLSESRRDLGLADRFTCVLDVAAGAAGEVVEIASEVAASGVQVAVSYGRVPRLGRPLGTLSRRSDLVRAFGEETPGRSVLHAADVVVSGPGGSSPMTALSLGVPLILYNPVPGQERHNVDFLINSGAALLARDARDVAEKLRYLSTHPRRLRQMAHDAAATAKPGAAETICERVLATIN